MKNTIIHPTDFSYCSDNALDYAIILTKVFECKLEIIHHLDLNVNENNAHRVLEEVEGKEREAKIKLRNLENKIQKHELKCEVGVHFGKIKSLFPEYAIKQNPKLIVMGTTGANHLVNKLAGSNTSNIIKYTESPVLAVPERAALKEIKNIIFLSDYREKDIESVSFISKIAESFDAAINIIHVLSEDKSKKINNQKLLDDFQSSVKKEVNYTNIKYQLLNSDNIFNRVKILINDTKPDLIVSVMRKQNLLEGLFFSSLIEKMVYKIDTPLLVMPE